MLHGKTLHLGANTPEETLVTSLKALASVPRLRILQCLQEGGRSVHDIAHALDMPVSTIASQIKILEDARFLHTEFQPASHGLQKICNRTYDNLMLELAYSRESLTNTVEVSMPVGAYTRFEVTPTCGLVSENSLIGYIDDPLSFYEPEHANAGLVWFRSGYLEYTFPNRLPRGASLTNVTVSMEICSEAPLHNNNWPSDITVWINDKEVGAWTCPGDFGGQRGTITPSWWDSGDSQYGVLKRWSVNGEGAFIDGHPLSAITARELCIEKLPVVTVRIGVKPDALHVGGINLFGRSFGNYPQDLVLRLEYTPARRAPE